MGIHINLDVYQNEIGLCAAQLAKAIVSVPKRNGRRSSVRAKFKNIIRTGLTEKNSYEVLTGKLYIALERESMTADEMDYAVTLDLTQKFTESLYSTVLCNLKELHWRSVCPILFAALKVHETELGFNAYDPIYDIMTAGDAAKKWGYSESHIKDMCRDGRVEGKLEGGVWLINKDHPNPRKEK